MLNKFHGFVHKAIIALAVQDFPHRVVVSSTHHLCSPLSVAVMTSVATATTASTTNGDAKKSKPNLPVDKQEFLAVFDSLKAELVSDPLIEGQPEFSKAWMQRMLEFNVPGGKLNRGMAVLDVLKAIKGTEVTKDAAFRANALGWCIEWLQAFFLVADDIMDNSVTRRGQPCWYRMPEVGMVAINDGIILESCIYRILKSHFKTSPYYTELLDLFHETTHQTAHGQLLDLTTAPPGTTDLSKFTVNNYMRIVTFKTAYYSFYLPVACGMLIAGIDEPAAFQTAKEILLIMGQYFQIQDDYLDCFGDPDVIGKIGTDIQDNKCGWLVVQALQKASSSQQQIIKDNYGKGNQEAVQRVKKLYNELDLETLFKQYEADSHEKLVKMIHEQELLPSAVFTMLLNKIYKRNK